MVHSTDHCRSRLVPFFEYSQRAALMRRVHCMCNADIDVYSIYVNIRIAHISNVLYVLYGIYYIPYVQNI